MPLAGQEPGDPLAHPPHAPDDQDPQAIARIGRFENGSLSLQRALDEEEGQVATQFLRLPLLRGEAFEAGAHLGLHIEVPQGDSRCSLQLADGLRLREPARNEAEDARVEGFDGRPVAVEAKGRGPASSRRWFSGFV